ncbi:MAG TPA: efflux RND transporter periplasmic adaptor subunit [Bryobacteraceae bacterium]|nr:efflux RND transporter periplasmic adaptor subunit [Bryobacteraceae bacterium]
MTTTELPGSPAIDDSKLASSGIAPGMKQPAGPAVRLLAHSRRRRWWLATSAVVVLLAAGAAFYFRGATQPAYLTAAIDRGDIEAAITTTGNTNAVTTVQVGSQVSGNVIALYADFNTKVKKGQLVARIDPAIFQAKVDQAKANLESSRSAVVTARATVVKADSDIANAQANVATAKANVVRARSAVTDAGTKNARRIELVKQGIIAQEDADTAQSTYDQAVASLDAENAAVVAAQSAVASAQAGKEVAQAQLQAAESQVKQSNAALQQAQLDLDHTQILAPVDGTVVSRNMDVGQTVAASFQAPTIFLIAQDLTKMQVDTNVDESDVAPIRVGQQANFTVDAYPGVTFLGVVSQIRQAPINVQNVITYDVVVEVSNADLKLFPGMTANVKIVTGRVQRALRLPAAAMRFRPAASSTSKAGQTAGVRGENQQSVYVLDKGQLTRVRVRLGISDGNYTEILGGLNEGQLVVIGTASKTNPAAAGQATSGTRRLGF